MGNKVDYIHTIAHSSREECKLVPGTVVGIHNWIPSGEENPPENIRMFPVLSK